MRARSGSIPAAMLIATIELANLDLAAVINAELDAQSAYRRDAGFGNR